MYFDVCHWRRFCPLVTSWTPTVYIVIRAIGLSVWMHSLAGSPESFSAHRKHEDLSQPVRALVLFIRESWETEMLDDITDGDTSYRPPTYQISTRGFCYLK